MDILTQIENLSVRTDIKFEYANGQIFPKESSEPVSQTLIDYILSPDFDVKTFFETYDMPKSSLNHKRIIAELLEILSEQINREEIRIYANDMSVKWFGGYYIPDLTFTLKKDEQYDEAGNLQNPISIIEVLSPATEQKDRNQKKTAYQNIETLQEYVLISQDTYKIEQFIRQGKTNWILKVYEENTQTCVLTVGVKIPLKRLYANTDWTKNNFISH